MTGMTLCEIIHITGWSGATWEVTVLLTSLLSWQTIQLHWRSSYDRHQAAIYTSWQRQAKHNCSYPGNDSQTADLRYFCLDIKLAEN